MEADSLRDILHGRGIEIEPGAIVRIGECSWRAQGRAGDMILRFIPQEAHRVRRAFRAIPQMRSSSSLSLQPLLDMIQSEGGALAVLEWVPGSTLRETSQDELPVFFDRLAQWHMANAVRNPLYSRYTDCEYRSIGEFLDGEVDYHLGILGLHRQEKACSDILEPLTSGFTTYIHGDVHTGNIVRRPDGSFALLDPEYLHVGCNYLDLDYIDWWGIEPDPAPWWIIKEQARASVSAYFAALEITPSDIPAIMKAVCLISSLRSHTDSVEFHTGNSDLALARVRSILDGGLSTGKGSLS